MVKNSKEWQPVRRGELFLAIFGKYLRKLPMEER
jgi:hypothetical protein